MKSANIGLHLIIFWDFVKEKHTLKELDNRDLRFYMVRHESFHTQLRESVTLTVPGFDLSIKRLGVSSRESMNMN